MLRAVGLYMSDMLEGVRLAISRNARALFVPSATNAALRKVTLTER